MNKLGTTLALSLLLGLVGCATDGGDDAPPPGPSEDPGPDAPPPPGPKVGGWRTASRDASHSYRSDVAGPAPSASMTVFYQHPSAEEFAGVSSPLIDEQGNLYLTRNTPGQPTELFSLSPSGSQRWAVSVGQSYLHHLTLGPDGHLYAIDESGPTDARVTKLVSFDTATGAARGAPVTVADLTQFTMAVDGTIYLQTWSENAGYGLQSLPSIDAAPTWTKSAAGWQFALSPAGDQLVMTIDDETNNTAPLQVAAIDPATGADRWTTQLGATATGSPTLAIDADGTIYVAASQNGSNLTIYRLGASGAVQWGSVIESLTWPSRILIGSSTVTIAAQFGAAYVGAGVALTKTAGQLPADFEMPCGEPKAIDANDHVYWGCDGGVQVATTSGAPITGWEGRYSAQIVLGPDGSAYHVPAAYFADHQLFRIK
ncbi:MAG TPA: hypothetical protein VM513_11055 [Kofleriaceae bacterium]|nr:hypothetical protein [Kofleriaceae bacterium]